MQTAFQLYEEGHKLFPRLFSDFIHNFKLVQPFFEYDPYDDASFQRRAQWLDDNFPGNREVLARELESYNRHLEAHAAAIENARRLGERGTLAVVTGQQAGLLGGPLFTLYKAVTTVRLARTMAHKLDRPVVPIFWVAGEDHDFDEVRRAYMWDSRGNSRELALPPTPGVRTSLSQRPVPRRVESILREVAQAAGEPLQDPGVIDQALEAARKSANWAEWFARLVSSWLSEHGLVVMDPTQPGLRQPLANFWPTVLLHGEGIHRETTVAANQLQRRGYDPGLDLDPQHSHLFFYKGDQRLALFWSDGRLVDREGQVSMTAGEATKIMREEPWHFSPNVVIRPMVQDMLIPTLALVAGPGEVAYLSQMRHVYPLFNLEMPVIYPRGSFTLIGPDVAELLASCSVGAGTIISGNAEAALQERLQAADPIGIDTQLAELRQRVTSAYEDALARLTGISPHLRTIGNGNLERILAQINYLEKKAWYHHRRRHRELTRNFQALENILRPAGGLQERYYSVLPVLARYGRGLIRSLLRSTPVPGHQLAIVTSGEGDPALTAPVKA